MISEEAFSDIVRQTPLVAIDFVIENPAGEILLGLRNNSPAKNFWFVPGGRIYKNETIVAAKSRILKTEIGLDYEQDSDRLLGLYDHIHEDNKFEVAGFGTHYVVSGWHLRVADLEISSDDQHDSFQWWSIADAMEHPQVHSLTKDYLVALR